MMLALDPGTTETAMVYLVGGKIASFSKGTHESVHAMIDRIDVKTVVVTEMIACYGLPVGAEIFETCTYIGEYRHHCQQRGLPWHTITRTEVKRRMCGRTAGVNDGVIRQRLIDMYGPGRTKAIGTKKDPGPLYGVSGDVWAALAVAKAWEMGT